MASGTAEGDLVPVLVPSWCQGFTVCALLNRLESHWACLLTPPSPGAVVAWFSTSRLSNGTPDRKSLKLNGFLATGLSGSSGFDRLSYRSFSPNDTQERHPAERLPATQIVRVVIRSRT